MIARDPGYVMIYYDLWLDLTPILTIDRRVRIYSHQFASTPGNTVGALPSSGLHLFLLSFAHEQRHWKTE
jgi:hypothetical protein